MTEPTKEPITKVAILSKKSLDVFNCHNNLTHELSGSTTGIPRLYHNVFIPEKGGKPHKADLSGAGFSLKMSFDQAKEAVEEALTKGKIDARIGTAWVDGGETVLAVHPSGKSFTEKPQKQTTAAKAEKKPVFADIPREEMVLN